MVETLEFKTPILVSQSSLFFTNRITLTKASLNFPSNRIRIQSQNPTLIANRRRRRSQARSQNSTRLLLNLASFVASNLKLLPPPLDLVLQEIGGGDGTSGGGGGIGFWKGLGWEGFDGWRRRRNRKRNDLWVYGFAAICVLGVLFGRQIESNAIWWGLGFGPVGIAAIRWSERIAGVQGWIFLGFCIWSFVVGMSFRREELQKWISRVRVSLPAKMPSRRRKSGRLF